MPTCHNFDPHVSKEFARVFGDNAGRILACTDCTAKAGIGMAVQRSVDEDADTNYPTSNE